jgi:glutamine amidotransferase
MCRLFGLTAGRATVRATAWLLDAPDSLELESRRNVDGSGIGWFDAHGSPHVDKAPEPAYRDADFVRDAVEVEASTFVAHVRYATTGERSVANTHPFVMGGFVMAHNGGFGDLPALEAELGDDMAGVKGDTDSERYAALVVREAARHGGDMAAGPLPQAGSLGCPCRRSTSSSLPHDLWALRYPGTHALHVLERPAGAPMSATSPSWRMSSDDVTAVDTVVVASERLDGEDGWRMLDVGELVHVSPDLVVSSSVVLPDPPAHLVPLSIVNPNDDS